MLTWLYICLYRQWYTYDTLCHWSLGLWNQAKGNTLYTPDNIINMCDCGLLQDWCVYLSDCMMGPQRGTYYVHCPEIKDKNMGKYDSIFRKYTGLRWSSSSQYWYNVGQV